MILSKCWAKQASFWPCMCQVVWLVKQPRRPNYNIAKKQFAPKWYHVWQYFSIFSIHAIIWGYEAMKQFFAMYSTQVSISLGQNSHINPTRLFRIPLVEIERKLLWCQICVKEITRKISWKTCYWLLWRQYEELTPNYCAMRNGEMWLRYINIMYTVTQI